MQQSQGKAISIYLMDGTSEGIWEAKLANWNGVGYRIPRNEMKNCGDIADLNKPGVYFLFGNEIETGRTFIYIGGCGETAHHAAAYLRGKERFLDRCRHLRHHG